MGLTGPQVVEKKNELSLRSFHQRAARMSYSLDERRDVPRIPEELNRSVCVGGKRLRPVLALMSAELVGASDEVGETIGRAAELTHGAFLAHDDVIDEAPKRRGRKSLNVRTSNLEAVLAGDALLSRVMVEISGLGHVEIVKSLSEAVEETVDGEWLQLEARGERNITKNHLQIVAIKKTSSLIQWCLKAPAQKVFSGSNENAKLIYQLDNLGKRLGLAFQMVDDLVDFSASSQKPYSQDLREGLINQVTWHLMDIWPELKDPISRLLGKPELDSLPWEKKQLSWAMEKVKQEAYAHCEEAKHSIGIIEQELSPLSENQKQTIQCFYELIQWIVQREH